MFHILSNQEGSGLSLPRPRPSFGPPYACPVLPSLKLEVSLFERLEHAGFPLHMLTVQYRMHPEIRAFPSGEFAIILIHAISCCRTVPYRTRRCLPVCLPACCVCVCVWLCVYASHQVKSSQIKSIIFRRLSFRIAPLMIASFGALVDVHSSPLLRRSSHRRPLRTVSQGQTSVCPP